LGHAARPQSVDTVRVELTADAAIVFQRIPNADDLVEAVAIRIPGQSIHVTDVVAGGEALLDATLTAEDGALRFAVASGVPVTLRYEVTGPQERIPLFVSGGGAVLTVARGVEHPHLIEVSGLESRVETIDPETSMPRFERAARTEGGQGGQREEGAAGGALEVRLSSLPSFVRLSHGGALSFARLADAAALALILLGAIVAYRRLRGGSGEIRAASDTGPGDSGTAPAA